MLSSLAPFNLYLAPAAAPTLKVECGPEEALPELGASPKFK